MPFAKKVLVVFSTVICVSALVAPTAAATTPTRAEANLINAINQVRAQHGLAPLALDLTLQRAARSHARSVRLSGVFAHGNIGRRLASFGATGPRVGENLAWGVGQRATAQGVVQSWMASPSHRANLLRPGFQRIGVGRSVGLFKGYRGAAVVTANFAGR